MEVLTNILSTNPYRFIGLKNKNINPIKTKPQMLVTTLISEAEDLIDDPKFKPYFYKTFHLIGPSRFLEAMNYARKEPNLRCRPCVFVHQLKKFRDQVGCGQTQPAAT